MRRVMHQMVERASIRTGTSDCVVVYNPSETWYMRKSDVLLHVVCHIMYVHECYMLPVPTTNYMLCKCWQDKFGMCWFACIICASHGRDAVLKDPVPASAAQMAVCWIHGFPPAPLEASLTPGLPQTVAKTFYEGIPCSGPTACA